MQQISEADLDSYLEQWMYRRLQRRMFPFFRGTITSVEGVTSGPPYLVEVQRTGETGADGNTYVSAISNYVPAVGDDVDLMWRDDISAYVFAPIAGSGVQAAGLAGWKHWSRTRLTTAVSATPTVSVPQGYHHVCIKWRAADTSANTTSSFAQLQIGTAGATTIDNTSGHYFWGDMSMSNPSGVPTAPASVGSGASGDTGWDCMVTTGGGTGAKWWSRGTVWFDFADETDQQMAAYWDIVQINNSTIIRRSGAGYFSGAQGALSCWFFWTGMPAFAIGSTWDMFVTK